MYDYLREHGSITAEQARRIYWQSLGHDELPEQHATSLTDNTP